MREYMTPDFDVTMYEIEDVITLSFGDGDSKVDSNGNTWYGD